MSDGREFLSRSGNQSFKTWLNDVLSRVKGEKMNIAAVVYREILAEENPVRAFQYFLQNADDIDSTEEQEIPARYTAAEIQKLQYNCSSCVKGILDSALKRNDSEDAFYALLWRSIVNDNPLLPEEDDIIFAICTIWRDERIPYFQLDEGLRMTNERFKEITQKNVPLLKKINFIILSSSGQRTEMSSRLLKVLSECSKEEDQAVIMAQILAMQERKIISQMISSS